MTIVFRNCEFYFHMIHRNLLVIFVISGLSIRLKTLIDLPEFISAKY